MGFVSKSATISDVGQYILDTYNTFCFPYETNPDINVLGPGVSNWISCQCDCSLVILLDNDWFGWYLQIGEQLLEPYHLLRCQT